MSLEILIGIKVEELSFSLNNFWNQIFKVVRDEKIFELIERVLKKKNLKVDEIIILLFNIKKVHDYLIHKNVELADFIMNIKFDLSEKKVKRKECMMDIYQAIVSYFNENDVELALNLFVDENINFEKEDESEIIQVYQEYSKSKKDYTLFLYDETVKAIKNNKLKDTLDRLFISEEREVFLDIMNKVLFDIVYFVKLEKDYINKILADFFDRVTHEVRIESFKKVLNYYVEEYEKTDDISVCSRAIMEKIHEYLKDPHKNSPKWQWGDFTEAQIEIMRIWLVSADLEKYFSIEVKDKIRLKFWKRYIKYIKEVRYFERLKQAIVMLTDEHIFIEFGEKGNAAYCHRKDYISFNEINRLSTNSKLKDRDEAVFFIPHSGNWEIKLKTRLYELGYRVKIWR